MSVFMSCHGLCRHFNQPYVLFSLVLVFLVTACDVDDAHTDSDDTHGSDTIGDTGDAGDSGDTETADAGFLPTSTEAFQALATDLMAKGNIPGMAVAAVSKDGVQWSKGFGVADIVTERLVTADTPFPIASISKTFIGTVLMQLEEDGIVSLDTPINTLGLPFEVDNPHLDGEVITLRHLTTHTSGILDDMDAYNCGYFLETDRTPLLNQIEPGACPDEPLPGLSEFLESYLAIDGARYSAERNFAPASAGNPGEHYAYSNVAAALAALAIGTAADTAFETLCEENIFTPLGMQNTHWHLSDFDAPDTVVRLHRISNGKTERIPEYSIATWPDGGLRTSANDLGRYLAAIINGGALDGRRILEEETVGKMLSAQVPDDVALDAGSELIDFQGVFWMGIRGFVGHTGGDPGIATAMLFDSKTNTGAVVLMNADIVDAELYESIVVSALVLAASI